MLPHRTIMHLILGTGTLSLILLLYVSYFLGDSYSEDQLTSNQKWSDISIKWGKVYEENIRLHQQISILRSHLLNVQLRNHSKNGCLESELIVPKCEVIHIVIVCAGHNSTRDVVTVLKSILFFRKNPLHFHFISDAVARYILRNLFDTWMLAGVKISLYNTEIVEKYVKWIPNKHYSGIYGLMKLIITEVIPHDIKRVIVLDTDIIVGSDIAELWQIFKVFSSKQSIGLVENQSDWYLGKLLKKGTPPWPALGRGFNTGVILLDLHHLRSIKWMSMWKDITEKWLPVLKITILADQDIFNTVLKVNPELVYTLPCNWNVQLSQYTRSDQCYTEVSHIKVIHWNSPLKRRVQNRKIEFFRNFYLTFLEYDGNLLRRIFFSCNTSNPLSSIHDKMKLLKEDDDCYDIRRERLLVRRVHYFYIKSNYVAVPGDVTLVTHLSMERLQMLEMICRHWSGPMSIALYMSDSEAHQFLQYLENSALLRSRGNIGFHIVYREGTYFPINHLRNVAVSQVQTDYMLLLDIDFVPSLNLYTYLKRAVANIGMANSKKALVIPAFETLRYRFKFPVTKFDLLSLLDKGTVSSYRYHVWPRGHSPTDFERWKEATLPYKILWAKDFEPYIVVNRDVPAYDLRFLGFGWNKASHIAELDALGYDFVVLPNAFIIHMPHAVSLDLMKFRYSPSYKSCVATLRREFQEDLSRKYGIQALKHLSVD